MDKLQLNVTVPEAELVMGALAELPLKVSSGLFGNLQQQIQSQLQANQPQPATEETKKAEG